jgi:hypothetical protein
MADSTRFEIRLPHALAVQIDDWRRRRPGLPNRAEAARNLIERGLTLLAPASSEEQDAPAPTPASSEPLARCPWLARGFRDGDKVMNVRIAERVALQVDFLAFQMGITKKQFVEKVLRDACAAELARLGITP